jgi:diguanylate cyclase (GGDEF)-like protein
VCYDIGAAAAIVAAVTQGRAFMSFTKSPLADAAGRRSTGRRLAQLAPFAIALAASIASIRYDLFEKLFDLLRKYEEYQADELCVSAILFLFALCCWLVQRTLLLRSDVEHSRELERQSFDLARRDALTDLPNRRAFMEAIDQAAPDANVMLIGLDRFKQINDWSGHGVGDKVLIEVAARLNELRASGHLILAARIGGDEFGCICGRDTERVAEEVVKMINRRMARLPDQPHVTASIAITPIRYKSRNVDQLLRDAHSAMYAAKAAGGSIVRRSVEQAALF